MDSRIIVGFATLLLPAGLIGLTIYRFSSNPLALLGLITVLFVGSLYQLSYPESF